MRNLYLLRGVSGSGKTTLARTLLSLPDSSITSTDDFFMVEGEYQFDPTKLSEYHQKNQDVVEICMRVKQRNIIVHNTFTQDWEMEPYMKLSKLYGYTVHSLVVENRHGGKNSHAVPDEVISRQKERFQIKL